MNWPSGDQAGATLGRHGATSDIHGMPALLVASARSWPPSASDTINSDEMEGMTCGRRNARRLPSGDHEMGLATLATNGLGVPPRNGTRHTSHAGAPAVCRTKSTDVPSGVNVAPKSVTPTAGGTIRTLLVVVVWRIHRL